MSGLVKTLLALWLILLGVAQGKAVYTAAPPLGKFSVKFSKVLEFSPPETLASTRKSDRFAYDCASGDTYGPFGETIYARGPHAQSCPFRYATKYRDEETGFYNFGRRFLDPITGQWLSREPLGESESLNLYSYCHNDPVNFVDVLGLEEHGLLYQLIFGIDPITLEPSDKEKERRTKQQDENLRFLRFLKEFENGQMDTKEFPLSMKEAFVRHQAELQKFHEQQAAQEAREKGPQIRAIHPEMPGVAISALSIGGATTAFNANMNSDWLLPSGAGAAGTKILFGGVKSMLPTLAVGTRMEGSLGIRTGSSMSAIEGNVTARSLLLPRTHPRLAGTNALGTTTINGSVYLRPGLSRAEQISTLRHEGVHAFLSVADNAPLAAFRQRVGIEAYKRSAFLNAAEETLAEGIASGSFRRGLHHAFNGAYTVRRGTIVTPWNAGAEAIGGGSILGGLLWGSSEFGSWLGGGE